MRPALSIITRHQRELDRLYGAIDNLWHRDHGRHQPGLRAIRGLVDTGDLTIADAIDRINDLDRQTTPTSVSLRIVTMPADRPEPCVGGYLCQCPACRAEVAARLAHRRAA